MLINCLAACTHLSSTVSQLFEPQEFDAYKLFRWDRARYLWYLSYPLAFDAPVRVVPVGISAPLLVWKKTRMVSLPDGKKISKTRLFVLTWSRTWRTDGHTDGQTLRDSKDRSYASHRTVKTRFSGKLSNLVSCNQLQLTKLLSFRKPIIRSLKSKMAEIRHLKNRHDVIFFCRGWSDLDKNFADWYRMTCRLRWCGLNRNQM